MSPENKPLNNMNILAGVNNLKNALNGQILAVEKIIPHERFNSKIIPYKNDIALIKLKKSIILPSQDELKISLPDNNCVSSNSGLRMCGWGKTKSCHSDEPPSNNLNCLTMFFINNNDCRNIYKLQFHDKQMCVTGGSGCGICFGDSGGPLVDADNKIVGIASGFYGGEFQRPDIFTKVCDYVSWIEDNKLQYNSL
ncbi:hypothetical protein HCN44_007357 [Aphidius gifuensis]|uniref:Peptidase S1 domain-containing protein n=1 Tax=Aphidius gifuensis TaxID=684658 RepID=A0A834XP13_APHGI|nr:hypothetical protein HCN44_007357 [Aphidius gifuensis]